MGVALHDGLFDVPQPKPRLGILSLRAAARPTQASERRFEHITFVASDTREAQTALQRLTASYGHCERQRADVAVVLGGSFSGPLMFWTSVCLERRAVKAAL